VLFADVSGFTAMSEQMDPEDVKTLADRWARRLSQEVRHFGGTVINVVGDEVVAVFGAPMAHEDDAERAVRAGLAMARLNLSDDPNRSIRVHVGINTGEVMAGLMGPRERRDYNIMGDTVNTAARLLSAAPAGTVLVGQETFRVTRRAVSYVERPPIAAKGKDQPVPVWEALDVVAVPQARPLGLAPLIGRDEELARLTAMWNRVTNDRQPHLVTIFGEAGMGKSRLVAEFEQRLPAEAIVLHGRCLPYGEALSYGALASMLKEVAGITAEDDVNIARSKLGHLVEQVVGAEGAYGDPQQIAQHLALLGGLDTEVDRAGSAGDHRVFLASSRRFLQALAYQNPLCLIIDDIQWGDDALLDLVEHLISRIQEVPLLVVTQARPELLEKRNAWGRGVSSFTSLRLKPLDKQAEQDLILALCRERDLSAETAAQMGHDAGGNPLFVEELVAMVAERGQVSGIPSAIKLLISARLDALPPEERQTLQLASVLGSTFWEGGLRTLITRDVTNPLEALEQKGLLRAQMRSQYPGEQEYIFKHDLIRDVAYDMLPRAERRVLHGQVADWFEQTAGEQIEAFFDLIAHHAVEAGQHGRAITYLMKAAERAGRARAHRQEAGLLAKAITLAEQTGQHGLVGDLRARCGRAFIHLGLWADARPELEAALAALGSEEVEQRVQVLSDLAFARFWLVDLPGQLKAAEEAMALAEKVDRDGLVAQALFALGFAHFNDAELQAAEGLYQRALTRGANIPIPELALAAGMRGLVFHWYGNFEAAIEHQRKGIQMGRNLNDTFLTAIVLPQLGLTLTGSGRYGEAQQAFDEAKQFCREYELRPFLARATAMSAGFHLDLFDYARHEAIAAEARELAQSLKFPMPLWSASIDLLLNYTRRQEAGRAEKLVDEVAAAVENAPGFHGWLWRLRLPVARAEMALARSNWEEGLRWAELGITRSNDWGRVKYHALGLESRAKALYALGRTHEAIADLKKAVDMIRAIGDPAIFLRVATSLLAIEGNDTLLAETQAVTQRIIANLPDEEMRRHFEAAEPVLMLNKL
jgi:class 3 adenylate cyclase/tetratricopeptide (TPR) repeat protein